MLVTDDGILIVVKPVQSEYAPIPIEVIDEGILIEDKLVQYLNV